MKKLSKTKMLQLGVAVTTGVLLLSSSAMAGPTTGFADASNNMVTSMSNIPNLLNICAYLFGVLLGILGVLKIKDHVENPAQTPLKDGAIRLAAGGALLALPFLLQSASSSLEGTGGATAPDGLSGLTTGSAFIGGTP